MPIDTRLSQVNAVSRTAKASGEQIFTSALNDYIAPSLTPELAWRYSTQNVHLADNLQNMRVQVFPGEPDIKVIDKEEIEDEAATELIQQMWYDVCGYASMQKSWLECMVFGCSIKSPGYAKVGSTFSLVELRDLPAITFNQRPLLAGVSPYVANGLMPGVVVDDTTGKTRVFQSTSSSPVAQEVSNFVIIKDPTTPDPAGLSYCLPVFPLCSAIDNAYKAMNQQVMRVGAPLIFPQLTSMSTDLKTWGEAFVKRWGKNVGFILPPGVTFANPMIHESTSAADAVKMYVDWIDNYFNPTTVVKKAESSIGGTDLGAMAIWNNFIGGQQAWIEYAYEEMLNPVLRANGFNDLYVQIRLTRPTTDRSTDKREQLKLLVQMGAITKEELRNNCDLCDLEDYDEGVEERLAKEKPAPAMSPFGNVGQVEEEDEFKKVDARIRAAIEAAKKRIVEKAEKRMVVRG
jgi:hypothetical protein